MSPARSNVLAVELWLPQGEVLSLGDGWYRGSNHPHGGGQRLEAESRQLSFHFGEGLPGAVWSTGRALLWRELSAPFLRAELAAEVGIEAAFGCPLYDGDRLSAVLTLLLGCRTELPSCLELWDVVDELEVLKHGRGYYAHCRDFERFSPLIQFPRGTGLPGATWRSGAVEVMEDLRKSNAFIRVGLAVQCGLQHGVGVPIYRNGRLLQVLAFFGGEEPSLIRGVELYRPRGAELGAATVFDWSSKSPPRASSADAPGRGLAADVLRRGHPLFGKDVPGELALGFPLQDRKGLREIVVLRF
jgi:hypothetical protein